MGGTSTRDKLFEAIKKDNEEELILLLKTGKALVRPDEYINESANFTALNIASSFGSIKAATLFLKNGWKVDFPEKKNLNSPLLLACKFGYLDLAKLFVDSQASLQYVNKRKINCLDMAIISGHYAIAHYLLDKELQMNTIEYYNSFIEVPNFNMDLFHSSLTNGVLPENALSFALKKLNSESLKEKDKNKDKGNEKGKESEDNEKESMDKKKEEVSYENKIVNTIEFQNEEKNNGTDLVLLSESKVLQDNSIKINMKNVPSNSEN